MDTHLNSKKHSEIVSTKCSRIIGIFNKLKHVLPLRIKIMLYNALLLPHINDCLMTWGLNKLQKIVIRIITLSKFNAHTSLLLKKLKFFTIQDLHKLQELKFYYKYIHNTLPANLQQWQITTNTEVHTHNTRRQNKIHIVRTRHTFADRCLKHNIPKTVNNTPSNVKEKLYTHSLRAFINYAKFVYIDNYIEFCTRLNCYVCNAAHNQ